MGNTLQDLMYGFFKDPNAYSTQFLNGTGAPGALAARKGDYYLNNSNGDMYYYNGTTWSFKQNLNTATGVTDHGFLSGLGDDDHPQYLNNARGDARYATLVTHPNVDDVLVQRWDSGLNRWQRVYYDSGVRSVDLSGSTYPNWTGTLGICRVNATVFVWAGNAVNSVGGGDLNLYDLPVGFRPNSNNLGVARRSDGAVTLIRGLYYGNFSVAIWGAMTAGQGVSFGFSFSSSTPIPTSLPGTLVSAAPA